MHNYLPNLFIFLDEYNSQIFKNKNINLGIIYRNYKAVQREKELLKISVACKRKRFKLFVSNDIKLAIKFKADGIYIPSFNKTKKFSNLGKKNMIVLGSAHSQKEIHEKIGQNCKAIFLSPLFYMKKYKSSLGLHKFNYLSYLNKIDIFPLGGISVENIRKIKLLNTSGLGSFRMFKKKPAYKRPVFLKK